MIKADIVNRVAELSDVPRTKAVQAVDTILASMKEALCNGQRIELRGFGVFQVRDHKRGERRTHERRTADHCFFPVNVPEAAPPMSMVPFIVEALSTVAV